MELLPVPRVPELDKFVGDFLYIAHGYIFKSNIEGAALHSSLKGKVGCAYNTLTTLVSPLHSSLKGKVGWPGNTGMASAPPVLWTAQSGHPGKDLPGKEQRVWSGNSEIISN